MRAMFGQGTSREARSARSALLFQLRADNTVDDSNANSGHSSDSLGNGRNSPEQALLVGRYTDRCAYFVDLLSMYVLPVVISRQAAMAFMATLHQNVSWFAVLFACRWDGWVTRASRAAPDDDTNASFSNEKPVPSCTHAAKDARFQLKNIRAANDILSLRGRSRHQRKPAQPRIQQLPRDPISPSPISSILQPPLRRARYSIPIARWWLRSVIV